MAMQLAPNELETVAAVMREHPEINTRDDDTRGRIVDYVAHRLNRGAAEPWGRKARNRDGSHKNTDGLTYKRPDGNFEIIDIIHGTTGEATWQPHGPFAPGENGWWAPAEPIGEPAPEPPPLEEPDTDLMLERLEQITTLTDALITHAAVLTSALGQLITEIQEVRREGVRIKLR